MRTSYLSRVREASAKYRAPGNLHTFKASTSDFSEAVRANTLRVNRRSFSTTRGVRCNRFLYSCVWRTNGRCTHKVARSRRKMVSAPRVSVTTPCVGEINISRNAKQHLAHRVKRKSERIKKDIEERDGGYLASTRGSSKSLHYLNEGTFSLDIIVRLNPDTRVFIFPARDVSTAQGRPRVYHLVPRDRDGGGSRGVRRNETNERKKPPGESDGKSFSNRNGRLSSPPAPVRSSI